MDEPGSNAMVPLVHEQIGRDLRRRLGRDWAVGERLPPIKALARQIGAGQSNTERAVRQLTREGLLASRRGRGTFVLGLPRNEPPPGAASVNLGTPPTSPLPQVLGKIVTVIHRSDDAFLDPVIQAVRQRLGDAGAKVQVKLRNPLDADSLRQEADAHAVVLINADVQQLRPATPDQIIIIVETSRTTNVQATGGYDHVTLNNEHGGFVAGCRLRERGVKAACFVGRQGQSGGTRYDFTSRRRLEGLQRGLESQIPAGHQVVESHYSTKSGARAAAAFVRMSPRPDAVFCASDELAIGFMHGALAHGLEAGQHFSLIGFDGQQRGRVTQSGPLTTVAAPTELMGITAAKMLIERFIDPQQPVRFIALACSILDGQTDGPLPRNRRRGASRSSTLHRGSR